MSRTLLSHFSILPNSSSRLLTSIIGSGWGRSQTCGFNQVSTTKPVAATGFQCNCTASSPESEASGSLASPKKKRAVSSIQPHLGNYLDAIENWALLQDAYETLFFIANLHAIILSYDAPQLVEATRNTTAIYLACGVDTSKGFVFVQSHVHAHLKLMWLLCSDTPIGWLNRMIQFKEKSRKAAWIAEMTSCIKSFN